MLTTLYIYRPGSAKPTVETVDLPEKPNLHLLHGVLDKHIGVELEHVSVLWEGRRADMFVGERSALDGSPVNSAATDIYHAATKARGGRLAGAPRIYGNAVVFDRLVWF